MADSVDVQKDFNEIPLLQVAFEQLTSDPSPTREGRIWTRTDLHVFRVWLNGLVKTLATLDNRLDQFAAPTADLSMNSHKLTNVTDPGAAQDAATKAYVDGVASGLKTHPSVRVMSTTNINVAVTPATINGVTVNTGDRLLLAGQTAPAENGVHLAGSTGTPMSRAPQEDSWGELVSAFVFVEEGTTNADTGWVCTVNPGGTLGTTAVTWTQFSGAGSFIAGAGLSTTGNTLDVNVDGNSLEVATDALRVKALGVVAAMLAVGAVDLATNKVTGVLPAANGGRASVVVASPALTAGTWTDVVHNLGTAARSVLVKVHSTGEKVEVGVRDKAGSEITTLQIKTDIPGGRSASFYDVHVAI